VCCNVARIPVFLPDSGSPMPRATGRALTSTYPAPLLPRSSMIATKVKFVPLSSKDRFTALQSGEVDVLVRNYHLDDVAQTRRLASNFIAVNYYDGQGFMVRKKLKVALGDGALRRLGRAPSRARRPNSTSPTSSAPTS